MSRKRKRNQGRKSNPPNPPRRMVWALVPIDLREFIEAESGRAGLSMSRFLTELLHEGLWQHTRKGRKR